jgi:hypothetical protein
LTHPKKDTSTQNTNFVISLAEPTAYAMLATLTDPIKTPLPTNTTTQGKTRQQITALNLTPHTRSILGETYAQLLTDQDITQLNINLTPLRYNQTKGLTGRPIDKMAWATTILTHTDVLQACEEGLQEQETEECLQTHTEKQVPIPPKHPNTTPEN